MVARYFCENCGQKYETLTDNGCCERRMCYGEPLRPIGHPAPVTQSIEGLCILVCDASYSMHDRFDISSPINKLTLVCGAIQRAVIELQKNISKPDDAFIGIIGFAREAALITCPSDEPFLKSVRSIGDEFEGARA